MGRLESTLILLLFGACLLAPAVAGLLGVRSEPFENRALAALPELRVARILDREMYAGISTYLDDHLPLRRPAVWADASVDVRIFGDSPHSSVRLGEGEWLYFDESLVLPGRNTRPVAEILTTLSVVGKEIETSGRSFHVVLIPNKYTIYPEHARRQVHELARRGVRNREELERHLSSRPLPGFLHLAPALLSVKERYDPLLFFPDDSHVSPFGAVVIARIVVDTLQPGIWEEDVLRGPRSAERLGDLGEMMVIRDPLPFEDYRVGRDGVLVATPEHLPQPTGYRLEIFRASSETKPLIGGVTLMIHDSSLNLPRVMMHPFFEEVRFLNWNSFDAERTSAMIAEADRVIVEMIERDFYWRTDELLGSEDFQRALRETLTSSGE